MNPTNVARPPIINKPAYAIVGCDKLDQLGLLVNPYIDDGYEPIGAPFHEPVLLKWCQCIYRKPVITNPSRFTGA